MSPENNDEPGQPQGGPPPRTKRKSTPEQRAASRRNGRKSRGAKNTSRTRYNGVKHGQCCKHDVTLPGESREEIDKQDQSLCYRAFR